MLVVTAYVHLSPGLPMVGCWERRRAKSRATRARASGVGDSKWDNYYRVLGVPPDATPRDIRKAYRLLQKKHHPDVAGNQGHSMTVLLNEAYNMLMRDAVTNTRQIANTNGEFRDSAFSKWNGPERPQALFVDEVTCIGCKECVYHASNTFMMDEALGCARVKIQYGDDDAKIKTSIDSCPVNCIHWVDREDLPILELLAHPHPKASNGIFGGGWERPSNVFMAATTYKRKRKEEQTSKTESSVTKETKNQRKSRMDADLKLRMRSFWGLLYWMQQLFTGIHSTNKEQKPTNEQTCHLGSFFTSELLALPVTESQVNKTVGLIKEWANTFASSSEVPLPMPFRVDILVNGVQLNLITTTNGIMECVGSLFVTVEVEQPAQLPAISDTSKTSLSKWFVYVRRRGTTSMQSLPGEGRIVQLLKKLLLGKDNSYTAYYVHHDS